MGLLLVDKPAGPTSHDMVGWVRRGLGLRRVGHAGTLDPFASGLLLVCVGAATRLVEELHDLDKVYEATARLGLRTTTDDPEGEVVETADAEALARVRPEAVERALQEQVGLRMQRPPVYSSKKVEGEAAHRRVRRGEAVELPPVPVRIHEVELLEVVEVPLHEVRFRVLCGTGTYIRAMARDLGDHLGVGAHLTGLRRTRIGPFSVDDALPASPSRAGQASDDGLRLRAALLGAETAVRHLAPLALDAAGEARIRMGQRLPLEGLSPGFGLSGRVPPEGTRVAMMGPGGLVGVGTVEGGVLRPRKVLPAPEPGGSAERVAPESPAPSDPRGTPAAPGGSRDDAAGDRA
jgi:tRNA pseudouridine55 synthase